MYNVVQNFRVLPTWIEISIFCVMLVSPLEPKYNLLRHIFEESGCYEVASWRDKMRRGIRKISSNYAGNPSEDFSALLIRNKRASYHPLLRRVSVHENISATHAACVGWRIRLEFAPFQFTAAGERTICIRSHVASGRRCEHISWSLREYKILTFARGFKGKSESECLMGIYTFQTVGGTVTIIWKSRSNPFPLTARQLVLKFGVLRLCLRCPRVQQILLRRI